MKICAISYHCCPFSLLGGGGTGGMSVYLREISSALTRFPEVKLDIFIRIQNSQIKGIKNISEQLRVIHLKGGSDEEVDRKQLYDFLPEFCENFEVFISQEKVKYDLIYSHYWLSGLVGDWIKQRFYLPLVHMYHTLAFLKKRVVEEEEHHRREDKETHLARSSDAIISSSWQEKKNLLREHGIPSSKVKIIYPGVNKELFYPYLNKEVFDEMQCRYNEKILLYVGRIEPVKGLMTIIEALELLKQRNASLFRKVKLVVIGGGRKTLDLSCNEEFIRIRKSIEEKGLTGKVIFLGSKRQDQLKEYYSAADALIVPSLYESFGLVVVEALACGTPVLVSQIGEMRTIVREGKNGFSFSPNDPSSLCCSIEHFFSQDKKLWERGKIRQNIIDKFSWEKTAVETYNFFTGIIKKKASLTTRFQPGESPLPA